MINTKYVEFHPFDNIPCQPVIIVDDPDNNGEVKRVFVRGQGEEVSEVTPVVNFDGVPVINGIYNSDNVRRIGVLRVGDLTWTYSKTFGTNTYNFSADLSNIIYNAKSYKAVEIPNILSSKYPPIMAQSQSTTIAYGVSIYNGWGFTDRVRMIISDSSFNNIDDFIEANKDVIICYEYNEYESMFNHDIITLPCDKIYIDTYVPDIPSVDPEPEHPQQPGEPVWPLNYEEELS